VADSDHIEILKQGVDAWNRWRDENPEVRPQLSSANLFQEQLANVDLQGADLTEATLSGADLSGANLRGANLQEAELYLAKLVGAELLGLISRRPISLKHNSAMLTFCFWGRDFVVRLLGVRTSEKLTCTVQDSSTPSCPDPTLRRNRQNLRKARRWERLPHKRARLQNVPLTTWR
jgi:uncharacterized protein YjbI with pentapeptide repeats